MNKFWGVDSDKARQAAFKVAAIYAFVAGAWIFFSDRILLWFLEDPEQLTRLQTAKGWFFVLASAGLLAWLVQHYVTALRRRDERLREIALGLSVAIGEALFNALAKNLATTLNVDCAIICELTGVGNENMKSLAAYAHGKTIDNFECRWAGTPCEKVLEARGEFFCPSGVRQQFPHHHLLEELAVESFLGAPLTDSAGRTVGLMMVMDSKPLQNKEFADEILPFFALRAAVELDRKRAVDALQESEALLRVVFDQAFQLMGLMKPDGTLIKINRTAADFIKTEASKVLDRPFWETPWWTHSPKLQERLRDAIKAAAKGEFVRFEATHPTPEGSLVCVDFSIKPVKDDQGNVVLLVPEGRDITERKRAEEALQESKRRLSTLMANLPGMAYRYRNDRDWTMEFVSDGCRALTGYSPEDVLGNRKISYADLIHPEDQEEVWQQVQTALGEKRPFQIEYRIRTAGGEERWVWEQGRGVFAQDGELLALEGFITDITERKGAEEVQSRLASIVESSDDAIIGKTLDGIIVDWNPGAKKTYGYSVEEIKGQSIAVLVPPEYQDRVRQIREKIRRGERIDHYESVHIRKDGQPIHVSLTVSPIRDAAGRLIGSSTVARDITWRKRLEEALRTQFDQITTIFDSLDAVVYAADLETSELIYLNRFGVSVFREDWQGRTVCEVLHTGEFGPCESCPSDQLARDGEPQAACHWESHNVAAERWYRCTDKAIRWSDGRLVRLGIAIDITELKQAE